MADQFGIMDDPAAQQDALEIARRRAIAAALTQQSMTQEDPTRTAGKYVVPFSPIQGLAKLAQAYAGAKINQRADTQETALQGRRLDYRKAMARSLLGADATPAQIAAAEAYPQQAAEYTLRKPDKPDAPSSDMQEYQTWEKQGGQGGIAGFMKFKSGLVPRPERLVQVMNPDGTTSYVPASQAVGQSPPPKAGMQVPQGIVEGYVSNQKNISVLDNIIAEMQTPSGKQATGGQGYLPDFMLQRVDPKGVQTRANIADVGSMILKDRSGAAVTIGEARRTAPFIPKPTDDAATVIKKVARLKEIMQQENDAMGSIYNPKQGFREMLGPSGNVYQRQQQNPQAGGGGNDPLGIRK